MGFIQPCFIRKNTPELRKKLEELGYKMNLIYSPKEQIFDELWKKCTNKNVPISVIKNRIINEIKMYEEH